MDRNGTKDTVVEAAPSRKRCFRKKILEAGLSDLGRPIQQTMSDTVNVIPRCAKETLGEARGGLFGEKESRHEAEESRLAYKCWQKTRAPEDLTDKGG
uniref:Uncharacterized protein n=1 Tax=Haemonchus contortus TaxID=6289 RepID=A0A7I4YC04_HAECO